MRPLLCRTAALAAVLALGATARADDFRCPDRGGPAWRELRTQNILLQTNLSSGKAQDLARELDRIYDVVRIALFRRPPPTVAPMRVVALRSEEEFDLFAPKDATAFYLRSTRLGAVMLMPGLLADSQRLVAVHEITHHVTTPLFARQPRWFAEGLACYMESMAMTGVPTVGGLPRHRYTACSRTTAARRRCSARTTCSATTPRARTRSPGRWSTSS